MVFFILEVFILINKKITPIELDERLKRNEKVILLDVRSEEKYNDFHIEDNLIESHNIPKTEIFESAKGSQFALPKEAEIIVTCTTGNSAAKCAQILQDNDYKVTVLEGGLTAWKEYQKLHKN
jgi:rhodanese-related sulfurtransferase